MEQIEAIEAVGYTRGLDGEQISDDDLSNYPRCRGDMSDQPERFVCCHDCYRYRRIIPSCGQRNCPRCQLKQSRRLMERLIPALQLIQTGFGRRWIAVTLEGYRVPQTAVGVNVSIFAKLAREFLKRERKFKGGLIVIEHTWKPAEREYYIHAHAFVLGDFVNQAQFERNWGSFLLEEGLITFEEFVKARDDALLKHPGRGYENVEGVRYCYVEDFRKDKQGRLRTNEDTIKAGLTYILKYISKGVALDDADLEQVRGLRYISTFGELYRMAVPVWKSRCKFCYQGDMKKGRLGIISDDDIAIIKSRGMTKGEEPLELVRVISWPTKQPKISLEAVKARWDELEEWWKRVKDGILPINMHKTFYAMRWLLGASLNFG